MSDAANHTALAVPEAGAKGITLENGALRVPDVPIIPFIEGDGTGPDIWRASRMVFDAAVQAAYGDQDIDRLRRLATPDMAGHFAQEIADNARQGFVNRPSDVRLLQGDLAEAWSEGGSDFATLAMRYSLVDMNVDRATGRLLPGSSPAPQEVTEVWTFVKPAGSPPQNWRLSAIQQA